MVEREIMRRVEAQTGRKRGTWQVSVAVHASPDRKRLPLEVVTFSDKPETAYFLFATYVTEAEHTMLPLMRKISAFSPRMTFTAKGSEYDFEDFCVRVGQSFDRHNSPSGVVVEIEYRPCSAVQECQLLIVELMERVAASLVPPPHTTQDRDVSTAAATTYAYTKVEIADDRKPRPGDVFPFSNRTSALLYASLLKKGQ